MKFKRSKNTYPPQFWLLFWGMFINRISVSMLWPFLTIYMYQKLGVELTIVTLLLSLRAVSSIGSTSVVSTLMDKIGRKGAMIIGVIASAAVFVGMALSTSSLLLWAALIFAHGAVLPVFNIGVQAMVADLIPQEKRAPAYALIRTISNAGIAIGPVIGGWLALVSFELVFLLVALVFVILAVLVAIFLDETKPEFEKSHDEQRTSDLAVIRQDTMFVSFIAMYFLVSMAYTQIWSLLPVYLSENFGFAENQYSIIITVNAALVVLFQYSVTKITVKYRPYTMITLGAALYAISLFSLAWGSLLQHFALSMVVLTIGELIINPTATTLIANIAPDNMRARYLGILSLAYPVGAGVGPVIGGFLNDTIAPVAIWYGAGVMGLMATLGFFILSRIWRENHHALPQSA